MRSKLRRGGHPHVRPARTARPRAAGAPRPPRARSAAGGRGSGPPTMSARRRQRQAAVDDRRATRRAPADARRRARGRSRRCSAGRCRAAAARAHTATSRSPPEHERLWNADRRGPGGRALRREAAAVDVAVVEHVGGERERRSLAQLVAPAQRRGADEAAVVVGHRRREQQRARAAAAPRRSRRTPRAPRRNQRARCRRPADPAAGSSRRGQASARAPARSTPRATPARDEHGDRGARVHGEPGRLPAVAVDVDQKRVRERDRPGARHDRLDSRRAPASGGGIGVREIGQPVAVRVDDGGQLGCPPRRSARRRPSPRQQRRRAGIGSVACVTVCVPR